MSLIWKLQKQLHRQEGKRTAKALEIRGLSALFRQVGDDKRDLGFFTFAD
jgi:hypothetical protein